MRHFTFDHEASHLWFYWHFQIQCCWAVGSDDHRRLLVLVSPADSSHGSARHWWGKWRRIRAKQVCCDWNVRQASIGNVGLEKEGQSCSLEPGCQLELSGAPVLLPIPRPVFSDDVEVRIQEKEEFGSRVDEMQSSTSHDSRMRLSTTASSR